MLQIHSIYQNQMVLQRDRPIPLRGRANPDSEVRVTLAGRTAATRSAADGSWKLIFAALPVGAPPLTHLRGNAAIASSRYANYLRPGG
jgi:sialate O-acetylesterase